jgi:hypothetical protein
MDPQHWLRHYLFEDLLLLWCELHLLLNLGPQLGREKPPALHPPLKLNQHKPEIRTSANEVEVRSMQCFFADPDPLLQSQVE